MKVGVWSKRFSSLRLSCFLCFWVLSWRFNLRRFALSAAAIALFLLSFPASAEPSTSPSAPGPQDYQSYQADLLIVKNQLIASRLALQKALEEKANIEQSLADAEKRSAEIEKNYDALQASATQHSADSEKSLREASAEVQKLKKQLADSKNTVDDLQKQLDQVKREYEQKLKEAAEKAKAKEIENGLLTAGCIVLSLATAGETAYIILHALGIWAGAK